MMETGALAVQVDDTLKIEVLPNKSLLDNPLHFKTTSTWITVGEDVKDYPYIPPDWYRNTTDQLHVSDSYWKHMEVTTKTGKVRKMKVGVQMLEPEIEAYRKLVEEFSDVFAWSYEELKDISRDMVEHLIPFISGTRPVRQNERRMNPRLQLLVKAELERLLQAGWRSRIGYHL